MARSVADSILLIIIGLTIIRKAMRPATAVPPFLGLIFDSALRSALQSALQSALHSALLRSALLRSALQSSLHSALLNSAVHSLLLNSALLSALHVGSNLAHNLSLEASLERLFLLCIFIKN